MLLSTPFLFTCIIWAWWHTVIPLLLVGWIKVWLHNHWNIIGCISPSIITWIPAATWVYSLVVLVGWTIVPKKIGNWVSIWFWLSDLILLLLTCFLEQVGHHIWSAISLRYHRSICSSRGCLNRHLNLLLRRFLGWHIIRLLLSTISMTMIRILGSLTFVS